MVRVIGQDPKAVKECTCNNCSARLEYTRQDIFVHRYSACGRSESDNAIRCAQCGSVVLV